MDWATGLLNCLMFVRRGMVESKIDFGRADRCSFGADNFSADDCLYGGSLVRHWRHDTAWVSFSVLRSILQWPIALGFVLYFQPDLQLCS
jgi:hypothetical protein